MTIQLKNPTQRHVWKCLVKLNADYPHGWTRDDLYMRSVFHHDLPSTLSESTVSGLLSKWWNAGLVGKKKCGRAMLYRLATV